MEIRLSKRQIDEIARQVARMISRELVKQQPKQDPEMVTTAEAARILGITPGRLRHIKDRFPYVKAGDSKQSSLLFVKSGLIDNYTR